MRLTSDEVTSRRESTRDQFISLSQLLPVYYALTHFALVKTRNVHFFTSRYRYIKDVREFIEVVVGHEAAKRIMLGKRS